MIKLDDLVQFLHAEGFKVQYRRMKLSDDDDVILFRCESRDKLLTFFGKNDEAINIQVSNEETVKWCTNIQEVLDLMKESIENQTSKEML